MKKALGPVRRMNWLTAAVIGLLPGAVLAGALVLDIHQEVPLVPSIVNPCNGEVVDLSGTAQLHIHLVINGQTVHEDMHINTQGVSGVGETTGAHYAASQTEQFSANLDGQVGAEETTTLNFHLLGQGGVPNFLVHSLFHATVNADGTVTSFVNDFSAECK